LPLFSAGPNLSAVLLFMESKTVHSAANISGRLEIPGDKSISHRAVILGALSNRRCTVENFLEGNDCLATVEALRALGVRIERDGGKLDIYGGGLEGLHPPQGPIDCGNSGTTARLLMGVLTGQPFEVELRGDESLSRRPMDRVTKPLSEMGAFFHPAGDHAGRLPLKIYGSRSVRPITYKSPVASAQVKSAVLLAGLYASGTTTVEEPIRSRDHTERMLRASGVDIVEEGNCISLVGTATVRASSFVVPGDISSAAFFLAAGLLLGSEELIIKGVGVNPTRTGFLDVIKAMGGTVRQINTTTSGGEPIADLGVRKSALKGARIGGEIIPRLIDEIPVLAALATQADGETLITEAQELRLKESDRLAALQEELSKMGARIQETSDGLLIKGPTALKGAVVQSHGDHRLAMSLAVAALAATGDTVIEDVACVATSFPNFWQLLDAVRK